VSSECKDIGSTSTNTNHRTESAECDCWWSVDVH
jgi:hypothetical protein